MDRNQAAPQKATFPATLAVQELVGGPPAQTIVGGETSPKHTRVVPRQLQSVKNRGCNLRNPFQTWSYQIFQYFR